MGQFLTGKDLDEKLTSIIWNAKKELIILSPFIHLDDYCKEMFRNYKHNPELELIVVFGKNEKKTHRSLTQQDLDFFKQFDNVVIIYCQNLHAKFYANESEGLLTSLNLLDKSMINNIEYGINFQKSSLSLDKLYEETIRYTNEVITNHPCVFVKRPMFKKTILGLSRKFLESVVVYDATNELYKNQSFAVKKYHDFKTEYFDTDPKQSREEFNSNKKNEPEVRKRYVEQENNGYCIRTGVRIPFNPEKPFCYDAYLVWAEFGNPFYQENYCHRTGKSSGGRTCMANPILY